MNPLDWTREEQVGLVVAALIGASLAVPLGYLLHATAQGAEGAVSFGTWTNYPIRNGLLGWALFGGLVGALVVYVRRLTAR